MNPAAMKLGEEALVESHVEAEGLGHVPMVFPTCG